MGNILINLEGLVGCGNSAAISSLTATVIRLIISSYCEAIWSRLKRSDYMQSTEGL